MTKSPLTQTTVSCEVIDNHTDYVEQFATVYPSAGHQTFCIAACELYPGSKSGDIIIIIVFTLLLAYHIIKDCVVEHCAKRVGTFWVNTFLGMGEKNHTTIYLSVDSQLWFNSFWGEGEDSGTAL